MPFHYDLLASSGAAALPNLQSAAAGCTLGEEQCWIYAPDRHRVRVWFGEEHSVFRTL